MVFSGSQWFLGSYKIKGAIEIMLLPKSHAYTAVHCLLQNKNSYFCIRNHCKHVGNTEKQS